jgi:hypothetical protein
VGKGELVCSYGYGGQRVSKVRLRGRAVLVAHWRLRFTSHAEELERCQSSRVHRSRYRDGAVSARALRAERRSRAVLSAATDELLDPTTSSIQLRSFAQPCTLWRSLAPHLKTASYAFVRDAWLGKKSTLESSLVTFSASLTYNLCRYEYSGRIIATWIHVLDPYLALSRPASKRCPIPETQCFLSTTLLIHPLCQQSLRAQSYRPGVYTRLLLAQQDM